MIINGVELEDLDIYDVEVAERYDKALEGLKGIEENKSGSMADIIKSQCTAIFDVFNTMFGEGTDKKVFGDRVNLRICLKAFEELVLQVNEQKSEIEKLTNKYSPNRAQRRAKK